jgi:Ca-activated chloride channel family protein
MRAGIEAALEFPHDPDRVRLVLFLTDGYIGSEAEIFALVDREIGDARLFSLGVGGAPNRYLLDGLAAAGRGAVTYAGVGEAIDPVVERFYDRIATPVLTDLEIDWGGLAVSDVLPAELPDLFAGQPLTVFGRYQGEPQGAIEVRAKAKTTALALPVGFDIAEARDVQGVSSVWARYEVDRLLGFPTPTYEGEAGYAEAKRAVI